MHSSVSVWNKLETSTGWAPHSGTCFILCLSMVRVISFSLISPDKHDLMMFGPSLTYLFTCVSTLPFDGVTLLWSAKPLNFWKLSLGSHSDWECSLAFDVKLSRGMGLSPACHLHKSWNVGESHMGPSTVLCKGGNCCLACIILMCVWLVIACRYYKQLGLLLHSCRMAKHHWKWVWMQCSLASVWNSKALLWLFFWPQRLTLWR